MVKKKEERERAVDGDEEVVEEVDVPLKHTSARLVFGRQNKQW